MLRHLIPNTNGESRFTTADQNREITARLDDSAKHWQNLHFIRAHRAVTMLLVGTILSTLGFLLAAGIGMAKVLSERTGAFMQEAQSNPQLFDSMKTMLASLDNYTETSNRRSHVGTNFLGKAFASGNNYRPNTVSEMVSDFGSPEGRLFFAFTVVGAIFVLMSWYPWHLQNVYLGSSANWLNFRSICGPTGMMLVACIPVARPVDRSLADKVSVSVHSLGAALAIAGYSACEFSALFSSRRAVALMRGRERCLRIFFCIVALLCGAIFQLAAILTPRPELDHREADDTCSDVWVRPTQRDLDFVNRHASSIRLSLAVPISDAIAKHRRLLYDTASGYCLLGKCLEYWFEVFSGLSMLASHFTIWYYCPERNIRWSHSAPPDQLDSLRPDIGPLVSCCKVETLMSDSSESEDGKQASHPMLA